MEEKERVVEVKYSIKLISPNGDNPPLKKKIKRTYSGSETPVILEQLKSMNNSLYQHHTLSRPVSTGNGITATCKRFLQTWKCAYYEMLNI
jgi:hypothetical protein